jgi:hypothetical protein
MKMLNDIDLCLQLLNIGHRLLEYRCFCTFNRLSLAGGFKPLNSGLVMILQTAQPPLGNDLIDLDVPALITS